MEINLRQQDELTVVELIGSLDGSLPAQVLEKLRQVVQPSCDLVLDLSQLTKVSAIGLRMLILLTRSIHAVGGSVEGIGLPQELVDMVDAAGFHDLWTPQPFAFHTAPHLRTSQKLPRIDVYPTHFHLGYPLRRGTPLPLGATVTSRGINFSIYSRHATACTLVLFEQGMSDEACEIPFPPEFRVGDVFTMMVFDLDPDRIEYNFRFDGPFDPQQGNRFDATRLLLDPMARALSGREVWGAAREPGATLDPHCRLVPEDFDWEDDRQLETPIEDLVIYEMHVRGFTRSPTSGVKDLGTFAAIRNKIPYLKALGVNCIELMPIFEFDECENPRVNPFTGEPLWNYWGYSTVGFFAPEAAYAATARAGLQADEFRSLVKELHRHGIEVILDVVFNHTAEGNEYGPTISFRGIDNKTYYMLTMDGHYHNFSGCGNTLNCNHPVVRDFVLECLRYWVSEYHVDGFRFDLASILGRDSNGYPLPNPPLLEALAMDAVLAKTKLIAEAWDAGGLYQVGTFPDYGRWAEWNGKYRDCVRKFLKGEPGQVGEMVQRVIGSPDLYWERGPTASINFITAHDGFTLADLVSYNEKHNEANGEENRDGANDNYSWNCGAEGPTNDPAILTLRRRQMKNALTLLLVSQGIPMLLMGDEVARTQQGNNNAYCHDGPLTWFDWTLTQRNADLLRFTSRMIAFRKLHVALRHPTHVGVERNGARHEAVWHGVKAYHPDWGYDSRTLAFTLRTQEPGEPEDVVYVAMNMFWESLRFELPAAPEGRAWYLFANTATPAPDDICDPGSEKILDDQSGMVIADRSIAVLVARTRS